MTDRLQQVLFEAPGRKLLNIKFCRGFANVSPAQLRAYVERLITEIETGIAITEDAFGDKDDHTVEAKDFVGKLA